MQTHSIQQHVSLGPVHPGDTRNKRPFVYKGNEKQVHCLHLPDTHFP